jgi:hypothetical protein
MKTRVVLFAVIAWCGCTQKVEPPPKISVIGDMTPQMPIDHPAVSSLAIQSRGPRRLSVDQIERSMDAISGLPAGSVKLPADLAVTLGKPDYKRVTEEQLQPTPLFMKFMLDLGAIVCNSLAQYEPVRTDGKFFTRFATVDENLSYLLLRFTGIEGADAAPYLTRLHAAYDTGATGTAPLAGYQAVCVSLFTSPEFLLY